MEKLNLPALQTDASFGKQCAIETKSRGIPCFQKRSQIQIVIGVGRHIKVLIGSQGEWSTLHTRDEENT